MQRDYSPLAIDGISPNTSVNHVTQQRISLHYGQSFIPPATMRQRLSKSEQFSSHVFQKRAKQNPIELKIISTQIAKTVGVNTCIQESRKKYEENLKNRITQDILAKYTQTQLQQQKKKKLILSDSSTLDQLKTERFQNYCKSLQTSQESNHKSPQLSKKEDDLLQLEIPYLKKRILDTRGLIKRTQNIFSKVSSSAMSDGIRNLPDVEKQINDYRQKTRNKFIQIKTHQFDESLTERTEKQLLPSLLIDSKSHTQQQGFYKIAQILSNRSSKLENKNINGLPTPRHVGKYNSCSLGKASDSSLSVQFSQLKWKCNLTPSQTQRSQLSIRKSQHNSCQISPQQTMQQIVPDSPLSSSSSLSPHSNSFIDSSLQLQSNEAKMQFKKLNNVVQQDNYSYTSIELLEDEQENKDLNLANKFKQFKERKNNNHDFELADDDPLYKNYSNFADIKTDMKRLSFNYNFKKQARLLAMSSLSEISQEHKLQTRKSKSNIQAQEGSKISSLSLIASSNKSEQKLLAIPSQNNILQKNFPEKTHNGNDNVLRLMNNEERMSSNSRRRSQNNYQQQLDSNNYKLESVLMTQIQENADDESSPQKQRDENQIIQSSGNFQFPSSSTKINIKRSLKKNQTMFIPQLKMIESIASPTQLKIQFKEQEAKQKPKQFSEKAFTTFMSSLKPLFLQFLGEKIIPEMKNKEQMNEIEQFCMGLIKNATNTQISISSSLKEKRQLLNEDQLLQIGDFFQKQFEEFHIEIKEIQAFRESYFESVGLIFKKPLLKQVDNGEPQVMKSLIESVLKNLHDKVNIVYSIHQNDIVKIMQFIEALLSDNTKYVVQEVQTHQENLLIQPIEFFIVKQCIFQALKDKQYKDKVIFEVLEKIEKVRNLLFPINKFLDHNFRKNISTLFLYNKLLVGYFFDPSVESVRVFINAFWDCMYGMNCIESFVNKIRNSLKTELTFKFFDLFQSFILANMPKTVAQIELQDMKFKFWKMRETIKIQQDKNHSISASLNKDQLLEAFKEITTIKSINKQTPLNISEQSVFDLKMLEYFFDFAICTSREVISIFECRGVMQSLKVNIDIANYWFVVLKQTLNSLFLSQEFCLQIENLFELLLIDQISEN